VPAPSHNNAPKNRPTTSAELIELCLLYGTKRTQGSVLFRDSFLGPAASEESHSGRLAASQRVNFSIWIHRWVAAHWNIRPNARDMCFISNLESKPSPQSINSICKFPSEGSLKVWAQNKRDDELSLCRGSSDSTDFLSSSFCFYKYSLN